MKKSLIKLSMIGFALVGLLITSCSSDESREENLDNPRLKAIQDHAVKLGYKVEDVELKDFLLPDNTSIERVFLQDDIALSEDEFFALEREGDLEKQYRTFNLVSSSNTTIDILGYTGNNQYGLSSKAQTGLRWAVANYNRLNGVSLNFRLTFGTDTNSADMVVYDTSFSNSGSGGVAGFPSNGRPYKWCQIYNLESFSTNVNEHVICHEMGHSIGFRHSDWFSRQSCNQSGESAGSDGAVHLAGTPTGWDPTSLMNACFSGSTGGEFNNNDITALQAMY